MIKQFETERFDLVKADKVRVANYQLGHNDQGDLDVWIERSDKGERFLSQIFVQATSCAARKGIYTQKCYILREKTTGHYWFLDKNVCGFWLQRASFTGAETFCDDESVKIQNWLAGFAN